jgi:hypothetical protein
MEFETTTVETTEEIAEETETSVLPTVINVVATAATLFVVVRTAGYVRQRLIERRAEKAVLNNLNNLPTEQ